MASIEERLTQDEALSLECVRLSAQMALGPNVRGSGDALIATAAAMEKFIKGEEQ